MNDSNDHEPADPKKAKSAQGSFWTNEEFDEKDWRLGSVEKHRQFNDDGNYITDPVIGPNLRWRDNLIQGICIIISIVVGSVVGANMTGADNPDFPWQLGAIVGGFVGMIAGLFLSGLGLMIFRAIRPPGGKRD